MKIVWIDGGREPQNPPDPRYPDGVDINAAQPGEPQCRLDLPYPAKRCGHYRVECEKCGLTVLITTAGRADDPRSATLACGPNRSVLQ